MVNNDIKQAIYKRAKGYMSEETVEEFNSGEDGELTLSKKKVTTKYIPADITAVKILAELDGGGNLKSVETMTDEELEAEMDTLKKQEGPRMYLS